MGYSRFLSDPPKKYQYNDNSSSRVGTSSTDSMTAETNDYNDELAFGTQFKEDLDQISYEHEKQRIKNDYELKKEKNLDQYLKDTTPVNPTRSQIALEMIKDIVPPKISDEPFKGHVFGLNPVKEKLLEDAIVKKKAENIVSDVSNTASRKVYNKARGIQFDEEQKAFKEKYNQNMSNLEEKKKLRDEELEKEIKLHDEKLEEEMKLGYEKLQEEMKLKNNELESNDKQDKELEKKIKDNWSNYNKIEITEEDYSELSKGYEKFMLNNIIDRIIEKTYDEIDNISEYS